MVEVFVFRVLLLHSSTLAKYTNGNWENYQLVSAVSTFLRVMQDTSCIMSSDIVCM